ncbi:ABC transporter ATP-binding protein [Ruegeria atlantica]|uniref:ABC transporter ATP-binding protein n=1 Tax=Ruegeria atlantica TaxID=81569 RepID=UPI0014805908|nr:ABC transporter ATP-binding protein [Ruegeria atlantica]
MASVELKNVAMRFGKFEALKNVSCLIEKGQFVTLLGASGSGKSTILNLIAGSLSPSSGQVLIDGKDVSRLPANQRGLGMVFQNYALMPHMTVYENLLFPLKIRKVGKQQAHEKIMDTLKLVHMESMADRKPDQLSGGQRQRVAVARSLVYDADIILMDEPLGALDKKLRTSMQFEIKEIHRQLGVTIIFVTHDQEEALTMSDSIMLLNEGRIEQVGSPEEMYFHPNSWFSADFLGESNVFSGQVTEATSILRIDGDNMVKIPEGSNARPGEKLSAMLRPENTRILRADKQSTLDNMINGRVTDIVFLGGMRRVAVRLMNSDITVFAQELSRTDTIPVSLGDEVRVGFEASALTMFPESH